MNDSSNDTNDSSNDSSDESPKKKKTLLKDTEYSKLHNPYETLFEIDGNTFGKCKCCKSLYQADCQASRHNHIRSKKHVEYMLENPYEKPVQPLTKRQKYSKDFYEKHKKRWTEYSTAQASGIPIEVYRQQNGEEKKMSLPELRLQAKENGLKGYSKMNKQTLIDALESAGHSTVVSSVSAVQPVVTQPSVVQPEPEQIQKPKRKSPKAKSRKPLEPVVPEVVPEVFQPVQQAVSVPWQSMNLAQLREHLRSKGYTGVSSCSKSELIGIASGKLDWRMLSDRVYKPNNFFTAIKEYSQQNTDYRGPLKKGSDQYIAIMKIKERLDQAKQAKQA